MSLKEILHQMVTAGDQIRLADRNGSYRPLELLEGLPVTKLAMRSHYQPGMYIAQINEAGYLGTVLYRVDNSPPDSQEG